MRKLGAYTVEERAAFIIQNKSKRTMQIMFALQIGKIKRRKNGSKHTLNHLIAARNICYKHFGIELPDQDMF